MTQEMCDKIVSKEPFKLKYRLDKFKTQEKCVKAIDSYLPPFKLISDLFVTNKMVEKLDNAVFFNNDIVFGEIDSDIATFYSTDIGLNSINFNNVNCDDDNFDDYNPGNIDYIRVTAWYNRHKQHKAM